MESADARCSLQGLIYRQARCLPKLPRALLLPSGRGCQGEFPPQLLPLCPQELRGPPTPRARSDDARWGFRGLASRVASWPVATTVFARVCEHGPIRSSSRSTGDCPHRPPADNTLADPTALHTVVLDTDPRLPQVTLGKEVVRHHLRVPNSACPCTALAWAPSRRFRREWLSLDRRTLEADMERTSEIMNFRLGDPPFNGVTLDCCSPVRPPRDSRIWHLRSVSPATIHGHDGVLSAMSRPVGIACISRCARVTRQTNVDSNGFHA